MKTLINNLTTIMKNAITAEDLEAKSVLKGFGGLEEVIPERKYPYIAIDDGGERVEDVASQTQTRVYTVMFDIGVFMADEEKALDKVLDISDQVKAELEKEDNRQKDGHTWGINIQVVGSPGDNGNFYRARRIAVDFEELEDREYRPY